MKIFPSSSIRKLDAYTIEHEPIASIDPGLVGDYAHKKLCMTGLSPSNIIDSLPQARRLVSE